MGSDVGKSKSLRPSREVADVCFVSFVEDVRSSLKISASVSGLLLDVGLAFVKCGLTCLPECVQVLLDSVSAGNSGNSEVLDQVGVSLESEKVSTVESLEVLAVGVHGFEVFPSQVGDAVGVLFACVGEGSALPSGNNGVVVLLTCVSSGHSSLQEQVVSLFSQVDRCSALSCIDSDIVDVPVVSLFTEESEMLLAGNISCVSAVVVSLLFSDVTEQDSSSSCGIGALFNHVSVEGFFLEESVVPLLGEVAEKRGMVRPCEGCSARGQEVCVGDLLLAVGVRSLLCQMSEEEAVGADGIGVLLSNVAQESSVSLTCVNSRVAQNGVVVLLTQVREVDASADDHVLALLSQVQVQEFFADVGIGTLLCQVSAEQECFVCSIGTLFGEMTEEGSAGLRVSGVGTFFDIVSVVGLFDDESVVLLFSEVAEEGKVLGSDISCFFDQMAVEGLFTDVGVVALFSETCKQESVLSGGGGFSQFPYVGKVCKIAAVSVGSLLDEVRVESLFNHVRVVALFADVGEQDQVLAASVGSFFRQVAKEGSASGSVPCGDGVGSLFSEMTVEGLLLDIGVMSFLTAVTEGNECGSAGIGAFLDNVSVSVLLTDIGVVSLFFDVCETDASGSDPGVHGLLTRVGEADSSQTSGVGALFSKAAVKGFFPQVGVPAFFRQVTK